jgi:hypothetical protein
MFRHDSYNFICRSLPVLVLYCIVPISVLPDCESETAVNCWVTYSKAGKLELYPEIGSLVNQFSGCTFLTYIVKLTCCPECKIKSAAACISQHSIHDNKLLFCLRWPVATTDISQTLCLVRSEE